MYIQNINLYIQINIKMCEINVLKKVAQAIEHSETRADLREPLFILAEEIDKLREELNILTTEKRLETFK